MALRGLKITWVCIAILFISLNVKVVHFCYFQNTFPFGSTFRQTNFIKKKRRKNFVEQGISPFQHKCPLGVFLYILVKERNILILITIVTRELLERYRFNYE